MNISMITTNSLRLHPILASAPGAWADDDPRFYNLCEDIRDHGIIEAIKITADNQIVDGRNRWRAALRLKLPEVPTNTVPDDQVAHIILRSLIHRRHYTAGQRAYLAAPLLDVAFLEARRRMLAGTAGTSAESVALAPDAFATQLGIHVRTLQQARQLHTIFANHPEYRDQFEPRILDPDDPAGLGGILAAIGSLEDAKRWPQKKTGGRPKQLEKQLNLFTATWHTLGTRYQYWERFDPDTKAEALKPLRHACETMPTDLLDALHRATAAELRRRKTDIS